MLEHNRVTAGLPPTRRPWPAYPSQPLHSAPYSPFPSLWGLEITRCSLTPFLREGVIELNTTNIPVGFTNQL